MSAADVRKANLAAMELIDNKTGLGVNTNYGLSKDVKREQLLTKLHNDDPDSVKESFGTVKEPTSIAKCQFIVPIEFLPRIVATGSSGPMEKFYNKHIAANTTLEMDDIRTKWFLLKCNLGLDNQEEVKERKEQTKEKQSRWKKKRQKKLKVIRWNR